MQSMELVLDRPCRDELPYQNVKSGDEVISTNDLYGVIIGPLKPYLRSME